MNIITPNYKPAVERKRIKQVYNIPNAKSKYKPMTSFKGGEIVSLISKTGEDAKLAKVFSQHYGQLADRIGQKLGKLATTNSQLLKKSSRYSIEKGALSIKDKKFGQSLLENIIFPFIQLPLYFANWVLQKVKSLPSSKIQKAANNLYGKAIFRIPRKLNEMDSKTNALDGIMKAVKNAVKTAAKKVGKEESTVLQELIDGTNPKASDIVRENLYKIGNKFFDKHTGNFNTAYERPLNRIVSGLIPAIFLANDAYNLSVLCGDKKDVSQKEAKERGLQEVTRVFTTAYIQLLTFGAFTKQVNNIPWFAPLASALTVLFSETFSRKKLNKPIFFLSKEQAKEHNLKDKSKKIKGKKQKNEVLGNTQKNDNTKPQLKNIIGIDSLLDSPKVFTTFKAANNDNILNTNTTNATDTTDTIKTEQKTEQKTDKKDEQPKALINFKTFRKGVIILLSAGFALSFLKNSSYTKNTKLVKGIKSIGDYLKRKIYNPLSFKDFEMTPEHFEEITKSIKQVSDDMISKTNGTGDKFGLKAIAEGHEFIKSKYAKEIIKPDGVKVIKMFQYKIPKEKINTVIDSALKELNQNGVSLKPEEIKQISAAVKTALSHETTSIAEKKFAEAGQLASDIIKRKGIIHNNEALEALSKTITKTIEKTAVETPVQMETKLKPFVDMVTQPFQFLFSVAKFPFKIATLLINMVTSPVQKKAAQAALGNAELSKFEKVINKVVTDIYGETKEKTGKIAQTVFVNAMEQLDKKTLSYRKAVELYDKAKKSGVPNDKLEILKEAIDKAEYKLSVYINSAVEKSFNGVTQSSNKNTDLAMMSKLASSAVTSAFLVADNYNMVMLKSNGEDKEGAKEKANERIIQRLSALFYQTMLINWFNATFRSTYNSSLKGMTAVVIPNTLATEILTRKSIGMPVGKKSLEELNAIDEKNENRKGFLGAYFKFMRLLTGKKPLKDRLPKNNQNIENTKKTNISDNLKSETTNLLEKFSK